MPLDLSVVIVNYNTRDMLQLCLENVFGKIKGISFEVFVVDNGSRDGSQRMVRERFPQVKLIQNRTNLGFAAANNVALPQCKGDFVMLINPDCFLLDSFGSWEIEFMRANSNVAVLGAKLLNGDGSLQYSCRAFPTCFSPLFGRTGLFTKLFPGNSKTKNYLLLGEKHSDVKEVDWVVGAFMLVRGSVFEEIGLLDEAFFLFCDDLDFCYRAKQAGYSIIYYPKVRAMHLVGAYMKKMKFKAILLHHISMYRFFKKHYGLPFFAKPFVWAGMGFNISYYLLAGLASKARQLILRGLCRAGLARDCG